MNEAQSWRQTLGLSAREHIALVGGGGKTTTLWSVAKELATSAGDRGTIATSTTKAGAPPAGVPLVIWNADAGYGQLAEDVSAAARSTSLVAVGSGVRNDRLQAVNPPVLDQLFSQDAAHVVNEADGARMKPFKAPAHHEPVLARSTTFAIIVLGRDAMRSPIDDDHLHRAELIAQLAGASLGSELSASHVAAIVATYISKIKCQAAAARIALLINKLDDGPDEESERVVRAVSHLPLDRIAGACQLTMEARLWRLR
ncbi:MAG: putative selenium-dependent hydroxylase accessory protein YqeC [Candidatus Eremiobacter antarcticus]|nr:MAG: putative selenium-dependent hydroxylase accessory protein YqeC [Candidatus Eremiobacter sp. RRmetagenome_bin22]